MAESPTTEELDFQAEYYFLYGSLMDHNVLARVLQQPHRPEIYTVTIEGWKGKMWGEYPALVQSPGNIVKGVAYEVRSPRERDRLIAYETDAYKLQSCLIEFGNGRSVQGKTFVWNDSTEALCYGRFDLKDWVLKEKELSEKH